MTHVAPRVVADDDVITLSDTEGESSDDDVDKDAPAAAVVRSGKHGFSDTEEESEIEECSSSDGDETSSDDAGALSDWDADDGGVMETPNEESTVGFAPSSPGSPTLPTDDNLVILRRLS